MNTFGWWEDYRGKRSLEHYGSSAGVLVCVCVKLEMNDELPPDPRIVIPVSGRTKNGGEN